MTLILSASSLCLTPSLGSLTQGSELSLLRGNIQGCDILPAFRLLLQGCVSWPDCIPAPPAPLSVEESCLVALGFGCAGVEDLSLIQTPGTLVGMPGESWAQLGSRLQSLNWLPESFKMSHMHPGGG